MDGEMEMRICVCECQWSGEDSLEPSQESYHCRDESTVDKRCVLIRKRARYGWLQQTGMVWYATMARRRRRRQQDGADGDLMELDRDEVEIAVCERRTD